MQLVSGGGGRVIATANAVKGASVVWSVEEKEWMCLLRRIRQVLTLLALLVQEYKF
jgi:hypothetical protein